MVEQRREDPGTVGQGDYVVRQGDCIDSIAFERGFFADTIWNHPDNAELKRTRKEPNLLLEGDRVTIPEKEIHQESAASEEKHKFKRKGVPAMLSLQLFKGGEPRADVDYLLIIDGESTEGTLDDEGKIETPIPPNAKEAKLILAPGTIDEETIPLKLGGIDPICQLTGVQDRLLNLGYEPGKRGELDDETRTAIANFQRAEELEPTGELDDTTKDALVKRHQS